MSVDLFIVASMTGVKIKTFRTQYFTGSLIMFTTHDLFSFIIVSWFFLFCVIFHLSVFQPQVPVMDFPAQVHLF